MHNCPEKSDFLIAFFVLRVLKPLRLWKRSFSKYLSIYFQTIEWDTKVNDFLLRADEVLFMCLSKMECFREVAVITQSSL